MNGLDEHKARMAVKYVAVIEQLMNLSVARRGGYELTSGVANVRSAFTNISDVSLVLVVGPQVDIEYPSRASESGANVRLVNVESDGLTLVNTF